MATLIIDTTHLLSAVNINKAVIYIDGINREDAKWSEDNTYSVDEGEHHIKVTQKSMGFLPIYTGTAEIMVSLKKDETVTLKYRRSFLSYELEIISRFLKPAPTQPTAVETKTQPIPQNPFENTSTATQNIVITPPPIPEKLFLIEGSSNPGYTLTQIKTKLESQEIDLNTRIKVAGTDADFAEIKIFPEINTQYNNFI
jgi:hypothetical protein